MKITEVRTRRFVFDHHDHPFSPTWRPFPESHQDVTIVEVHTDEGITGIGEAACDGTEPVDVVKAMIDPRK